MHSICDTVFITSDEIPRDLLRDRKIIRFRVISRFGLTPGPYIYTIGAYGVAIVLKYAGTQINGMF